MLLTVSILEIKGNHQQALHVPLHIQTNSFTYITCTDISFREGLVVPFDPRSFPLLITLPTSDSAHTFFASDLPDAGGSVDRWIALFAAGGARLDVHVVISVSPVTLPDTQLPFHDAKQGVTITQINSALTSSSPSESEIAAVAVLSVFGLKPLASVFARLAREFTQKVRSKPLASLVFPFAPCNLLLRAWLRLHLGSHIKSIFEASDAQKEAASVALEIVNKFIPVDFVKNLEEALHRSHPTSDVQCLTAYMLVMAVLHTEISQTDANNAQMLGDRVKTLQSVAASMMNKTFKQTILTQAAHKMLVPDFPQTVTANQRAHAMRILAMYASEASRPSSEPEEIGNEKPEFVKLLDEFVKRVSTGVSPGSASEHYFHHYHLHQSHNSVHFNSSSAAIYSNTRK